MIELAVEGVENLLLKLLDLGFGMAWSRPARSRARMPARPNSFYSRLVIAVR
jgi:hypothetical protein